ncbi:reducing type I polyketide synthase 10 [Xylaria intraflava]|nr:reducing type I polyketide synthase 10 [Xylaria intraflava]
MGSLGSNERLRGTSRTPRTGNAEPIAICGFACHLPGGSNSPGKFWDLISAGRSAQCDIPESRFNVDGFYHPRGMDRPGSIGMKGGYFIQDDVREFENSFFGINNLEATYMDPQQRKLLEVVFQCLENAGVSLDKASGSNTGCYVGNFTTDYQVMQRREFDYAHHYTATGSGTTILANRISHVFNLVGPSLVLDTACSSSLYCLHVACAALENHECDAAIVAGANLILSPEQHIAIMKAGVLSATSTCHTFDSSADGYGRADGVGALYVKRLDDAIAAGDPIRSVIRGSAINANGRTTGVSLPSFEGQVSVIEKAMSKAKLGSEDIAYVECHGTGTRVGDATEVDAIAHVFQRTSQDPLLIGSVKTNVGHSEAVSGISSIIKTTMAMERGLLPPTYGLKNINPKLKVKERNISIPTELTAWPDSPLRPRRVGINSFGYGGANAHCILEEVPQLSNKRCPDYENDRLGATPSQIILPLSAASVPSLEARVADFADFDFGKTGLLDLAYTLGSRRTQFPTRGYFITSRAESIQQIFCWQKFVKSTVPAANHNLPYVFAFTGQGSQWPGMGSQLFNEFSVFRRAISEMDMALKALPHAPSWSLQEAIMNTTDLDLIHLPERSQPCCTAIQVALIQLLATWDISPAFTVGHSSGEIAAAFAAGHISAAEAIVIAYYRGYVVSEASDDSTHPAGSMMAVGLSGQSAEAEIIANGLEKQLRVACVNSPESVTISGDDCAVEALLPVLAGKGVFARKLKTGGQAYHSHHMLRLGHKYESLLDEVLPALRPSTRLELGATFVSSVTVGIKSSNFGSHYWRQNLESQVQFAPAIRFIQQQSDHCFVELGPHSSLELPIKQTLAEAKVTGSRVKYAAPLKRNTCALQSVLNFAGSLWFQGCNINWSKVNGLHGSVKKPRHLYRVVTDLPPYRFNYENRLWTENRSSIECRQRPYRRHELLGSLMPSGNGRDFIFRNLLKVGDISWMKDHKLGETVVFPGAGYLVMAIEAITQVNNIPRANRPSFCFSNVNITNALALSTEHLAQTEIFLSLRRSNLTNAATSSKWWEFNVSTYVDGSSISHATGSIAVQSNKTRLALKYQPPSDSLEPTAKRTWYERLAQQGLNYGPTFQTITHFETPRMKSGLFCTAEAPLLTALGDLTTEYPVHPITLDALFQMAAVSAASGVPRDLQAVVPTRITSAIINTVTIPSGSPCHMNSLVRTTGFGSMESGSELVQADGEVAVQFDQVKLQPYSAGTHSVSEADKRHPVLRLLWKPDAYGLGFMEVPALEKFAQGFSQTVDSSVSDPSLIELGGVIDLLVHKEPQARILELENESHDLTTFVLDILACQSDFKRFSTYSTGFFDSYDSLQSRPVDPKTGQRSSEATKLGNDRFDIILVPVAGPWIQSRMPQIMDLLAEGATLVILGPQIEMDFLESSELSYLSSPIDDNATLVVARHVSKSNAEALQKHKFLIVERERSPLGSALADALGPIQGHEVTRTTLENLTAEHVLQGTTVFNLCELYSPLLSMISDQDMQRVKVMTDNATSLIWVTGGNVLQGEKPDSALSVGLARAVGMEQPSLKFYTYDVDSPEDEMDVTAQHLISVLNQQGIKTDMEFVQRDGVVHVSRFVPDDGVNLSFRNKQGLEPLPLSLAEANHVRLAIERPSQFDTIFFKEQEESSTQLSPEDIRIKVGSAGINAKDFYVLAGRIETQNATCQLECAGTVVGVGSGVTDFAIGDRVVAMAPMHFQTYQTLPTWACHKLAETDSFDVCATLPVVYSTALYALHYRARIQAGESILIHSGAGGVGIAAIEMALAAGAEVFTTVSTDEKRDYLTRSFGIKPSNIFSSRDTSFLEGILAATAGRGVDVVLNSLTGDQLHATWKCVAEFGRFVEIGKVDLSTAGRLEMDQFLKNTTFTAFDLSHLYYNKHQHSMWQSLLSQVMDLYHQGKIARSVPLKVFDISKVADAFRQFALRSRIGKIAINLENVDSRIKVQRQKYMASFNPEKSYVMIGCLGGLGRTLTRWMASRGARKFAFLGRSGLQKSVAQNLIRDLDLLGVQSVVVRGDVCSRADVRAVIDAAAVMGTIGGVVQAAMGLNEAVFADMPTNYWHTGIDPKVKGSWNLYNALKSSQRTEQLDFFLMTSSVSGSAGTATEANYCAGNYFLDLFARYLRTQGLPGVSVGLGMISEVGYLHENPDIEALLLRKGIQPIDADDLLQIIDLALSSAGSAMGIDRPYDELAASHLLTGLEASGIQELRKKGFEGNHPVLRDARSGLLATALGGDANGSPRHGRGGILPEEVLKDVEAGQTLAEAVLKHVRHRFANLVLMKADDMAVEKPLAEYGMDSMLGAEFRTWLYQTLMTDVPLSMLLGKTCTLEQLSTMAVAGMQKAQEESK